MTFFVNVKDNLKQRISITIASNLIEKTINSKILNVAKKICINGFRKGKVPLNIINKYYSDDIQKNTLNDLMQNCFINKIIQEKINLINLPKYIPSEYKIGQDFKYLVEFEEYPIIKLKGLDNIIIEKPIVEINNKDIETILKQLNQQKDSWEEIIDVPANIGDRVTVNFVNKIKFDEILLEKKCQKGNYVFIIGQDKIAIPNFDKYVISRKSGEQFSIDVHSINTNLTKIFKDKNTKLIIKINKIERLKILFELNKTFTCGYKENNDIKEQIYNHVKINIESKLKKVIFDFMKNQLINNLVKANNIHLPDFLVKIEINILKQRALKYSNKYNQNNFYKLLEIQAKHCVKVGLLIDSVIKKNKLKVDNERVEKLMNNMLDINKQYIDKINLYENKNIINNIRNKILEDQAIELLLNRVKIDEKRMSLDELMNKKINIPY